MALLCASNKADFLGEWSAQHAALLRCYNLALELLDLLVELCVLLILLGGLCDFGTVEDCLA